MIHEDAQPLAKVATAEGLLSLSVLGSCLLEIVSRPTLALRSMLLLSGSRSPRILLKNLAVVPKSFWLARLLRREGVDHVHAQWASTTATTALLASALSGTPWSFAGHRWDIREDNLLRTKAQTARFVRVIDARGRQEMSTLVGPHPRRVVIIHMGVTTRDSHEPRVRQGGPLRVLMVARLDEGKGHRYAVDALALLEASGVDVELDLAGEGPLRSTIEAHALRHGVRDLVRFLGLIDHERLLTRLGNGEWDVALLPSVETRSHREGIPVALIEAMAAGVPVVATATGGIPELLADGAGLLIPQRDAGATAAAMARLAAEEELRRELAERGLERVHAQYAVQSTASALVVEMTCRDLT
jgi:glycosyltransferase involved in cell wall biosynthesis